MSLKFSDTRQLISETQGPAPNVWRHMPAGAQPIATAPERSGTPVIVIEANGHQHYALHHNGAWQKLSAFKDFRDGSVSWRMDGTSAAQP